MRSIETRLDRLKAMIPEPMTVICKLPTGKEAHLTVDECIAAKADPIRVKGGSNIKEGSAYGGAGSAVSANQPQDIVINLTTELDGAILARQMMRYNARAESLVGPSRVVASRQ